ncbi:MAG: sporulation transcriptional regulator SpoIIID [Clostridia bacterium]|nr:sporulation transcriptional regulator SpoIIID [Clostridia bacterium]
MNNTDINERVLSSAHYIIENNATVRQTADAIGISKSTVHSDVCDKLKRIDSSLYSDVRSILEYNLSVRHIRGGISTKNRYEKLKEESDN